MESWAMTLRHRLEGKWGGGALIVQWEAIRGTGAS